MSFFLVTSTPLVYQQFAFLNNNIGGHNVARVCGSDNVDKWQRDRWKKLLEVNRVIVATADILHRGLTHCYIVMDQINLLIFDEAHHAKKDHVLKSIKARFATPTMFQRMYTESLDIARHLGRWCADRYLVSALSDLKSKRYEFAINRKSAKLQTPAQGEKAPGIADTDFGANCDDANTIVAQQDRELALLRDIIIFVGLEQGKHADITDSDLSSKVTQLKRYLREQFGRPSSHRCIVFVDARQTARLLDAVFKNFGMKHLRSGFLVGANSPGVEEDNFSARDHLMVLNRFRKGEINCLFATSVAEEGLDVPDCNLVICFDQYRTMIQYIQSRGRARRCNSKFVHMIEIGNSIHEDTVYQVLYQEQIMRKFCQSLPEDRRLEGNEDHLEVLMEREKNLREYVELATKAKLTFGNALATLAHFVSAIPTKQNVLLQPTYVVQCHTSKFVAEVILPGNAPIRCARGRPCTKKSLAKRSAAFEACLQLRQKKYLDEHLMPIYQKKLPAMQNAMLAVNMKKSTQYVMRPKPSIWAEGRGTLPSEVYITIVDFPDGLKHAHQPLALITRTPMPSFPEFPIYMTTGRPSTVRTRVYSKALTIDEAELQKLTAFTFRVFDDAFSKKYEQQADQLSYWLAPVSPNSTSGDANPSASLDWKIIDEVFAHDDYKWSPEASANSFLDKLVVDPWDGSRKFYTTSLRSDLNPQSPIPADVAKHKWMGDILNYSNSLFKKARGRREGTWNLQQPVFEATKISPRRNLLAVPAAKEVNVRTTAYICLEPLRISVIPPKVASVCFVWPAVVHRLESYLIAVEACNMLAIECSPGMALAAVTKDSENSGEHENQERIDFQSGMGENYERLEFIGDTFLKTATTISTFIQNPNDNEFEFHVRRMLMLCNKNLYNVALGLKLYEYIRSMAFSRRLWYPEGLKLLEGKGVNKNEDTSVRKHVLGEKTIADVCEALIGAAYLAHDRPGEKWQPEHWGNAVRAVTKLVASEDHAMMAWDDYRKAYEKPEYQTCPVNASYRDLAERVELAHPYHFQYPRLLWSAFQHPSIPSYGEKIPSYRRLEFLGDALLDMAIITYLFYRFPDKDPQWLTEHKMAMVSNKFLGALCVNIGLWKHLRHHSPRLQHQIGTYADELLEAKRVAGTARDYWTTVSDPPKCLPDIFEAFIGAMFIDSNFDYNVV